MKSITTYITEKLKIKKSHHEFNSLEEIIKILKENDICILDKYNEDNLIDDLFYKKNNIIDNIQFEDDWQNVSLFYTSITGDNFTEGDKKISIDEWYDYISEKDTNRILDHIKKLYNVK